MEDLPIFALRAAFDAAPTNARLVISSPTGSGKSTEVPRWCTGRVLVVEPRRVACRALASRVAEPSTCQKASKMWGSASCVIPTPVSATWINQ